MRLLIWRLTIALLAAGALVGGGCGGSNESDPQARPASGASAPASSTTTSAAPASGKRWRLVREPIVVMWLHGNPPPPSYEVYLRLDRPLPRGRNAVEVTLEGVENLNTSGLGYDESAPGRCYARGFDNPDDFPRSLRRPRAGQRVTVRLRFLTCRRNVITTRVSLQLQRPEDAAPPVANPAWLKLLGCRP